MKLALTLLLLQFTQYTQTVRLPQITCSGIYDDTIALQLKVKDSTTYHPPSGCKLLLSEPGILINHISNFAIVSDVYPMNFGRPTDVQLIWNSNGGTMFKMTSATGPRFEGLSFVAAPGKCIDGFLDFDGAFGTTPTQGMVYHNSFNGAQTCSNPNFTAISFSKTSLNNNENYQVINNDINCPSEGIGILNGPSANAKQQVIANNRISYCDIGVYFKNGSFYEIANTGGGFNKVDIRIDNLTEPGSIRGLDTENSQMGLDIRNISVPIDIDTWTINNVNQLLSGFASFDGQVTIRNSVLHATIPNGGVLFRDNGSGNLTLNSIGNNYFSPVPTTTNMQNIGFTAISQTATLLSTSDNGIIDSPTGYGAGSFMLLNGYPPFIQGLSLQRLMNFPQAGRNSWCIHCQPGSLPCISNGPGAWAFRNNTVWNCPSF